MHPEVIRAAVAVEVAELDLLSLAADAGRDLAAWIPDDLGALLGLRGVFGTAVLEELYLAVGADPEVVLVAVTVDVGEVHGIDEGVAHVRTVIAEKRQDIAVA